jgi:uncharacterized protein YwlG (UPF0340 family)
MSFETAVAPLCKIHDSVVVENTRNTSVIDIGVTILGGAQKIVSHDVSHVAQRKVPDHHASHKAVLAESPATANPSKGNGGHHDSQANPCPVGWE